MGQGVKKFALIAGGVTLLVLVIALVMPKERADQLSESILRLSGNSGIICLDYHRTTLKDPDSASLIQTTKLDNDSLQKIQITYKAKNSFGAFVTTSANCTMNKGAVHVVLTELRKDIDETSRSLESQNDCLDKKIVALKQNNPMAEANFQVCKFKGSLPR